MKTRPFWFYRQSGVIPYRISDGAIEVLLVSSRGGARWVVPKGVVEIGMMSPVESACREAYEEGGRQGECVGGPDRRVHLREMGRRLHGLRLSAQGVGGA
jgi:8-oxo-dGTP pyrophosphatase MutT (NUDIX family)